MFLTETRISGFDPDPSHIDPQFGRNRLSAGSRAFRGRLKHRRSVLAQRVADLFIGLLDVVVAVNFASFTHQSRSFRVWAGGKLTLDCRNASFYRRQLR